VANGDEVDDDLGAHSQRTGPWPPRQIAQRQHAAALVALEPLVAGLAAHSEFTAERRQAGVGLQGLQDELFSDAHDGLFLPGHRRRSNVERALENRHLSPGTEVSPMSWHCTGARLKEEDRSGGRGMGRMVGNQEGLERMRFFEVVKAKNKMCR